MDFYWLNDTGLTVKVMTVDVEGLYGLLYTYYDWNLEPVLIFSTFLTQPKICKEPNLITLLRNVDVPLDRRDYRGINNTPIIARAFEKAVYSIFNKQDLDKYLDNSQFAYRTGGSCTNALIKMQHIPRSPG